MRVGPGFRPRTGERLKDPACHRGIYLAAAGNRAQVLCPQTTLSRSRVPAPRALRVRRYFSQKESPAPWTSGQGQTE